MGDLIGMALEGVPEVRLPARGGSMWPAIHDGDLLTYGRPSGHDVHVGDVVAFRSPGGRALRVHRVVGVEGNGLVVKGDACSAPDGVVSCDELIAVVTSIRRGRKELRRPGKTARALWALLSRTGLLLRAGQVLRLLRRLVR